MKGLTTGEMLDRLFIGDVATNQDNVTVFYNDKGDLQTSRPDTEAVERYEFSLKDVAKDKWDITHSFVTFQEAMQAFEDNKTVIFHLHEDSLYTFNPQDGGRFKDLSNDSIELRELIVGRWIIVNRARE
ncbi:hypothetical protein [Rossellomorea marisflavi]|uniref:hypothetical protein n=1 Tax=Rossellomorea marisflavi TaxID=189381 RepID=UPI003FA0EC9A